MYTEFAILLQRHLYLLFQIRYIFIFKEYKYEILRWFFEATHETMTVTHIKIDEILSQGTRSWTAS